MKTSTVHQLKQELIHHEKDELVELCLRLAKFKKENKELLSYLLFEADDEARFIEAVKLEIKDEFDSINRSSAYLMKKSVRRILKDVKKYIRYSKKRETELELLIAFCEALGVYESILTRNTMLGNIYKMQMKAIAKVVAMLHEDLQYDYEAPIDALKQNRCLQ